MPGEPFSNSDGGILFIGTKGKLLFDCYGENPRLLPTKLMTEAILPKEMLPRVPGGHYLQWINASISGYENSTTISNFEYAGPFVQSVLIGNLAIRSWIHENKNEKGKSLYPGRKKLLCGCKVYEDYQH